MNRVKQNYILQDLLSLHVTSFILANIHKFITEIHVYSKKINDIIKTFQYPRFRFSKRLEYLNISVPTVPWIDWRHQTTNVNFSVNFRCAICLQLNIRKDSWKVQFENLGDIWNYGWGDGIRSIRLTSRYCNVRPIAAGVEITRK